MTAEAPYESLREVVEALATACRDGLIHNTSDEDTVGVLEDAARAALAANKPAGEVYPNPISRACLPYVANDGSLHASPEAADRHNAYTRQAQAQGSEEPTP